MTQTVSGISVALLASSGFDEQMMTEIQRAFAKMGVKTKTISPETGIINGWQGQNWGHYFSVDLSIGDALGSDFDMLVLPGGERSIAKLKANPHTRRIINHFLEADKPIAAFEAGVALLALSPKIAGRLVAAPSAMAEDLIKSGATLFEGNQEIDGNLLTSDGVDRAIFIEAAIMFVQETTPDRQAA